MSELNASSRMPIKRSYIVAAVIFLLLGVWVASGYLMGSKETSVPTASAAKDPAAKADAKDTAKEKKPTVRTRAISAEQRQRDLIVRGQTQALRKVQVRAETAGAVAAIRADKGATVKAGDTICELNVDGRMAMLKQARATMTQRSLEHEASKTLQGKGFRSETSVAGALAAYEAAKAQVERMEKEFENTKIRAPFDGIIDDRMADVGDYLSPGQPCALVVDQDPFLVVGQVSEKDVAPISIGDKGWAKLVTGERVEGKVRFVAKSSDPATRTFRVELEVSNADGAIRDGVTAEMHIAASMVDAHRISPAILSLDARGVMGVRIVDEKARVRFMPVTIISDGTDGVWVSGLPREVTIITIGQDYVSEGQEVTGVPEDKGKQS
jgi:membrane fusion protein, multidrug efflux system